MLSAEGLHLSAGAQRTSVSIESDISTQCPMHKKSLYYCLQPEITPFVHTHTHTHTHTQWKACWVKVVWVEHVSRAEFFFFSPHSHIPGTKGKNADK